MTPATTPLLLLSARRNSPGIFWFWDWLSGVDERGREARVLYTPEFVADISFSMPKRKLNPEPRGEDNADRRGPRAGQVIREADPWVPCIGARNTNPFPRPTRHRQRNTEGRVVLGRGDAATWAETDRLGPSAGKHYSFYLPFCFLSISNSNFKSIPGLSFQTLWQVYSQFIYSF